MCVGSQESYAKVDAGEAHATDRVGMERAPVEISPFHEQVREGSSCAELPDLRPESSLDNRRVEIADPLPFDKCVLADRVVACRQPGNLDLSAEPPEEVCNPASGLMAVDNDPNRLCGQWRHFAPEIVPGRAPSLSAGAERP